MILRLHLSSKFSRRTREKKFRVKKSKKIQPGPPGIMYGAVLEPNFEAEPRRFRRCYHRGAISLVMVVTAMSVFASRSWGRLDDGGFSPPTAVDADDESFAGLFLKTIPSASPTMPTLKPTDGHPTAEPSGDPSRSPSPRPTPRPTPHPTPRPSVGHPTLLPTPRPSFMPIPLPTARPTFVPIPLPTPRPTFVPIPLPTPLPTPRPTFMPIPLPTPQPTEFHFDPRHERYGRWTNSAVSDCVRRRVEIMPGNSWLNTLNNASYMCTPAQLDAYYTPENLYSACGQVSQAKGALEWNARRRGERGVGGGARRARGARGTRGARRAGGTWPFLETETNLEICR